MGEEIIDEVSLLSDIDLILKNCSSYNCKCEIDNEGKREKVCDSCWLVYSLKKINERAKNAKSDKV